MNPTNFFYWLQGYFELSGSDEPLTLDQASMIIAHANLVAESDRGVPLVKIQLLAELIVTDPDLSEGFTSKIQNLASETFEHVIDPAAGPPDEQERLNAIHNAGRPMPSIHNRPPLARC